MSIPGVGNVTSTINGSGSYSFFSADVKQNAADKFDGIVDLIRVDAKTGETIVFSGAKDEKTGTVSYSKDRFFKIRSLEAGDSGGGMIDNMSGSTSIDLNLDGVADSLKVNHNPELAEEYSGR